VKRKSGIPTGKAGEYFVMGELLRRGFDAQLADRNTKGYDLLVGRAEEKTTLHKVQVKTATHRSWWVNRANFEGERLRLATVYVLMHIKGGPVRYFIVKNRKVRKRVAYPSKWKSHGFVKLAAIERYENHWEVLLDWLRAVVMVLRRAKAAALNAAEGAVVRTAVAQSARENLN
jgi:hypothetical protein